jgi:hypothetical protein
MKLRSQHLASIAVLGLFVVQLSAVYGTKHHENHHNGHENDHAHARDQHVAEDSEHVFNFNEQPDVCSDCCNGINLEACAAVSCPPCEPNICADCCRGINVDKCAAVSCVPCDQVLAADTAASEPMPCDKTHEEPTEIVHENLCGICCSEAAAYNAKCQTVSNDFSSLLIQYLQ